MRSLIAVEAAINFASKQTGQLPSKSLLQKAPFCAQSHRKTANFFYPLDVTKLIALWKLSGCESKNKKRHSGKRWVTLKDPIKASRVAGRAERKKIVSAK